MDTTDVVYVIGHRNPDLDSIAAALGYAWVLATRDGLNCRPARAGEVNAQTAFALKRFGVEPPELLTDAWMRVGRLAQPIAPLSSHRPLGDAARALAAGRRPIPVVDDAGKPIGIITGADLFAALNDLLTGPISARLEQRLAGPCLRATDRDVPMFRTDERVRDVRPLALRGAHDDFSPWSTRSAATSDWCKRRTCWPHARSAWRWWTTTRRARRCQAWKKPTSSPCSTTTG